MGNIGGSELVIIFVLALLLLGPRRLPEVGEALGRGLRRFRQASRDLRDELDVTRDTDLRRDLDVRRDLDAIRREVDIRGDLDFERDVESKRQEADLRRDVDVAHERDDDAPHGA